MDAKLLANAKISMLKDFTDNLAKAEAMFEACQKLENVGVKMYFSPYVPSYSSNEVKNIKDFHLIKKGIGPVKQYCVEAISPTKVKVTMQPVDKKYDGLYFWFTKRIPENGKCKVKVVRPTRHRLVCQN